MNETTFKIDKIRKTSRIALILVNIIKILLAVVAVACLLSGAVILGLREEVNSGAIRMLDDGFLRRDIFAGQEMKRDVCMTLIQNGHVAEALTGYLFMTGAMLAAIAVMFHFIGRVFKDMRESYSPFQLSVIKKLKIVFVLITLFTLRSSLLIGALTGVALWCVLQIFDYGCELQRESDETL